MNRQIVENTLMEMGMPATLKGFTYITDAVMLLDTLEWKSPKWTALYYKIAAINNDTPTRVERAIRSAFVSTRNRVVDYDIIEHYIGFANCENSSSLLHLYKNVKKEYPNDEQVSYSDIISYEDLVTLKDTLQKMLKLLRNVP